MKRKVRQDSRQTDAADLRRRAEQAVREQAARSGEDLEALTSEQVRRLVQELRVHQIELEMQNDELCRAQADLARQRERYFDLYDLAPVGYCTVSNEGLILEANLTVTRLLSVPRSAMLRQPFTRFILPQDQDIHYLSRKRLLETGAPQACEVRMLKTDSAPFPARLDAALARGPAGEPLIRVVISDLTEHALYQTALTKMQRLESLGVLAGGIAHDFNNILTAILGNISLLESLVKSDSVALELVRESLSACGTAKRLANQLLTFAKGGSPVKNPLDLRPLLTEAAGFAARGSGSRCVFDLGETPLIVDADADQVRQVIQNLVLNATQAMRKSGEIKVRASTATLKEGEHPGLAAGRYVLVSVEDPGGGIAAEALPRIFDPYFSTKTGCRGLGLAVCHSIMTKHGGDISAASRPGEGAVFTLHFPAVDPAASPSGREPLAPSASQAFAVPQTTAAGRILVMDDEAAVAKVLGRMLQRLGYQVESTRDGESALEAYAKAMASGRPFDAVILDLTIPGGMGGKDALAGLKKLDPKVKAIVSSGYANDPVMSDFAAHGFSGVMTKPFIVEELAQILASVLGRKPA